MLGTTRSRAEVMAVIGCSGQWALLSRIGDRVNIVLISKLKKRRTRELSWGPKIVGNTLHVKPQWFHRDIRAVN